LIRCVLQKKRISFFNILLSKKKVLSVSTFKKIMSKQPTFEKNHPTLRNPLSLSKKNYLTLLNPLNTHQNLENYATL